MSLGTQTIVILLTSMLGTAHSDITILSNPSTSMAVTRKGCEIPRFRDYYYMSLDGNTLDMDKCYDGSGKFAVKVHCSDPLKEVEPDDFAVCFDGNWYPSQHTCVQRECEPVYDTYSTHHKCTTHKGVEVDCRLPAVPGTKITIRCAHWRYKFTHSNNNEIVREKFCQRSGIWQKLEVCKPVICSSNANINTPLEKYMNNSSSQLMNKFPWNAVIYHYKDDAWTQLCVGTVITSFHILTAQRCFYEGMSLNGTLKIAVGEYFKSLSDYDEVLVYDVMQVHTLGPSTIGLIAVSKYIEFSDTVGPVCMRKPDLANNLGEKVGHILTWGEDGKHSMLSLQWLHYKCQTSREVRNKIPPYGPFFCSLTNNHTFSPDELGAGLVFSQNSSDILAGVLVGLFLNGRAPIFLDIGDVQVRYFVEKYMEEFYSWFEKEEEYWFRRRGEY